MVVKLIFCGKEKLFVKGLGVNKDCEYIFFWRGGCFVLYLRGVMVLPAAHLIFFGGPLGLYSCYFVCITI